MPSTLKEIIAVNSTDLEIKYKDTVNVKEAGWSIFRSSKLHKFTKKFHIIKDFSLNIKIIFKSTSFQNLLQLGVLHIKSTLKLEKTKLNNNYNVKRNRKDIDRIRVEKSSIKTLIQIKMLQNKTQNKNKFI